MNDSEQGTRTDAQKGTELLGQAVEAYRSALEVRTRHDLPQQWAPRRSTIWGAR
jgi:hypothetical protein